jgi:glycosyl hydrolase family 99
MRLYQGIFLCSVLWASSMPRGCDRRAHDRSLQELAHSDKSPKIIAAFQPWFGDPDHIRIDYNSNDPSVIQKQIRQAKSLGIYAFAVDWYGSRHPFLDRTYALMQQIASQEHFHVALMYDETEEDNGHATEDALDAFSMAYKRYIGPEAPARDAYLLYNSRPVIFIFPKRGNTDWNQVRQMVSRWDSPPILIYKDEPPPQYESAFDGQYAWVHPGPKGWTSDGQEWGEEYLQTFYKKMDSKHPDQIAVGTIWPGFDDTRASWSLNRHMDTRCGKTLEDTLRVFEENESPSRPMPFLLIATWNDYEEGTAIENGIARCSSARTPHS